MKYSKSFLITLGHNSSVIFFDGANKPIGYEEERLTKKKSDSSYPKNAIDRILGHLSEEKIRNSNVFISHWFDKFDIEDFPSKYFDHEHFKEIVEVFNLNVIPVSESFTHHDAHAFSSLAFFENYPSETQGDIHYIVADGFGNNQEVISIYKHVNKNEHNDCSQPELIKRVYGYEHSLGLMYQYATSFCGMKENQDEYKFLGYEVLIKGILNKDKIEEIKIQAYKFSMMHMQRALIENTFKPEKSNDIIDFKALGDAKAFFNYQFVSLLCTVYTTDENIDEHTKRIVIGYFVQQCIEQCLLRILSKFNIENVILSGGCFLNVKLNRVILEALPMYGHICINPLAGDQGAAIGLFRRYTKDFFIFDDLCFGVRDKFDVHSSTKESLANEGIIIVDNEVAMTNLIYANLRKDKIVNIMRDNMEFGPRALCNTSTLAIPTGYNSHYINKVNKRNEVMPMAPVITKPRLFFDSDYFNRTIGSNHYMIMTHKLEPNNNKHLPHMIGVLHKDIENGGYTCRPQYIKDNVISRVLDRLSDIGVVSLINTSFNTHGTPILFSFEDAIIDFRKQKQLDDENRLTLIMLIRND